MQCIVPFLPSLFQAIQCLEQPFGRTRSAWLVSRQLLHVDLLVRVQLSVEVCRVEVECFYVPVVARSDGEDKAEACEPRDWGISVVVVDPINLCEALCYQACLILIYASIRFPLEPEDPLAPNDVLSGWAQDHGPSSSVLERTYLTIHRLFPARPVGARLCLLYGLRVTFNFQDGCGDDLLVPCEVSPLRWIWVILCISHQLVSSSTFARFNPLDQCGGLPEPS